MNELELLVSSLQLQPHPEGGFYRETYRSSGNMNIPDSGIRNYSTCIYYLLTADTFSAFHRIKSDEIWHFYKGHPIHLHLIDHNGRYNEVLIGNDIEAKQTPQFIIPAGYWFAASVDSDFALAGCTVSPGFDFQDFELADRAELIGKFPEYMEVITKFTRILPAGQ